MIRRFVQKHGAKLDEKGYPNCRNCNSYQKNDKHIEMGKNDM